MAVLTFLNLSFESLAEFEAQCCCIRLIFRSLALLLLPVKPLPVQLKKGNQEERSRNTMAKRLHSDLDSDEDLEDNTTKDEG